MDLQAGKAGGWGIFPQVSEGADPGDVDPYWFRGNLFDMAPMEQTRELGDLVGSGLLPGGLLKTGIASGGRAVMPPALDDYIWWLVYAAAGAQESSPDVVETGAIYKHYAPDKTAGDLTWPAKYLAAYRIVPSHGTDLGEILLDQTVARIQFGFAGMEIVTFQADFMGKDPYSEDADGSGVWEKVNAAKGQLSVPIGSLPVNSFQVPVATSVEGAQAIMVDVANRIPGIRDVAQVGQYGPHSWPVLGRAVVATVRQLYTSSDLYRSMIYDAAGNWNPIVFNSSLQISGQSPNYIGAEKIKLASGQGDVDAMVTDVAYGTSEIGLSDTGQDFTDWETAPPGAAAYWIAVYDANGDLQSWGYCGADDTLVKIEVYKDPGLTIRGWTLDGSAGTPTDYKVFATRRYEVGFKGANMDFRATPPVLEGGGLMRMDYVASSAQAESGLDWHIWVVNRTASYTWPSS